MAATTTPSCTTFFDLQCTSDEPEIRRSTSHGSPSCGRLDRVATWVGHGVATAFFASLDRCSCIKIATVDDGDDGHDLPLICKDANLGRDVEAGGSRRIALKRKKRKEWAC
ncbi:hypothetical protein MRB53_007105 [Persea americana]|uniref:Uncharacterized protein n=1 Tax=Persea americana TaxID=3435 RepID=A0ACC2MHW7_PERAE|nr:hypothetical protein MRB53_007105 [Persea americana]